MTESESASGKVVSLFGRRIQMLNDHEFYNTLAETTGPSIVFFTKPGCSSCRLWKRLLEDLLQQRDDIHVYRVDAEQNMALSHEYELFHLPALFLFVDGEYHCALQSEARLEHLQAALDLALDSPAEEAP
jgi:thioredoxin-like negative regulator of GroEL